LTRVSFHSTLARNMSEITWIDRDATGAGEISISIAATAVGNATLDAIGIRLRELPFAPERAKAGLSQT
jgi:CO/xanthine dehydrogenase Mo-binding subunit